MSDVHLRLHKVTSEMAQLSARLVDDLRREFGDGVTDVILNFDQDLLLFNRIQPSSSKLYWSLTEQQREVVNSLMDAGLSVKQRNQLGSRA